MAAELRFILGTTIPQQLLYPETIFPMTTVPTSSKAMTITDHGHRGYGYICSSVWPHPPRSILYESNPCGCFQELYGTGGLSLHELYRGPQLGNCQRCQVSPLFCMVRRYMIPHLIGVAPHYLPLLIAPQRQSPSGMQQWLTIFVPSIPIISFRQGRCQSSPIATYSHWITGLRGLCAWTAQSFTRCHLPRLPNPLQPRDRRSAALL